MSRKTSDSTRTSAAPSAEKRNITIAIAGNPNCGKTTVFNALTGSDQRVGNWPGVTVEKKEGFFSLDSVKGKVIDLPGIYSLSPDSEDEVVARRFLAEESYDLVMNIVDASNLERNLYLTTQLLEMNIPVCIVFSKADLARKNGLHLDTEELGKVLGVPLVSISAVNQQDLGRLKQHLDSHLVHETADESVREREHHHLHVSYPEAAEEFIREIDNSPLIASPEGREQFRHIGSRSIAAGLLEQDPVILELIDRFDPALFSSLYKRVQSVREQLPDDTDIVLAEARYAAVKNIRSLVKRDRKQQEKKKRIQIDDIVMHPFWGVFIFFGIMYLVFWVTMIIGGAFIDFFDILVGGIVVDGTAALLQLVRAPDWLITTLAGGVGGGLQTISTFIPIIFSMFLMLGLLEDSGYMARAAYVMDRFMRFVGLPGKAFVPMLIGFGCTVPAIMATRTLESRRDRFLTIFMTPFMSCGARLPVYALFAAAFFPKNAGFVVFSIYIAGIVLAVITGLILKHTLFKGEFSPFVMELPVYNVPQIGKVSRYAWDRLRIFMFRAGQIIIIVVFVLTLLNSWGIDGSFGNENSEKSVLAQIGKTITPVFKPMGISDDNWPATVGLFTGIFAKEAIVGTLNSLYIAEGSLSEAGTAGTEPVGTDAAGGNAEERQRYRLSAYVNEAFIVLGQNLAEIGNGLLDLFGFSSVSGDQEQTADMAGADSSVFTVLRSFFTQASAYAYMLFVLIYFPCVAALGAVFREAGKFYGVLLAGYLTILAWIISTLFYQIAEGHSFVWIVTAAGMWVLIYLSLVLMGFRGRKKRYEAARVW